MRKIITIVFFCLNFFMFGQSDFNYYFNLGQEKYEKGNFNEAISSFNLALKNKKSAENDYKIANAYKGRALCKMNLKSYTSAIEDISFAIGLKPEYSDLYLTRSFIHFQTKQYNESISWADIGLKLKPKSEELILLKARSKFFQKKYSEVLTEIDTLLLTINPKNLEAWNLKGEAKERQKDYKGGIEALTNAIAIDAQCISAFYNRGICRAELKDFDGALADMTIGMDIDSSQRWVGCNNIAFFIKFEQKDYIGSLLLFDEAIKLNPKFDYAFNNRGYAKLQMNDLKGAREDIVKSLEINEKNSYAYKTYAKLLFAEKKEKLACEKLKKALDLGYSEEYDDEVNNLLKEHCK